MAKRKVTVTIGNLNDMANEFIDVWHQVKRGKTPKAAIEKIIFEDERLLFKTLTPKRCALLKYVHQRGKLSVRALAKELLRDYSNVYQDVKALAHVGLMVKDDKDDKYLVPWDKIVTEIPLTSTTFQENHTRSKHHKRGFAVHVAHG
jgi:predicted transcriptional regulator